MNVTKSLIALTIAAGFATASFAQGTAAPAPAAAPAAKVVAPAPAAAEKKVEAPQAAEPMKAETTKSAKPAKALKHHHQAKKAVKAEATPAAAAEMPVTK